LAELTGSGSVAIAASIASFKMLMVSGGKLAYEKSFIESVPFVNVCNEVAERLRVTLSKDQSEISTDLINQLDRLREMEENSPSIVP
jgi:hypothetical protein